MKVFHSLPVKQPCCSITSDATGWSQGKKKKDNIVKVDCGQICSQRHEITGACKTLE